jgi:hypothetical protein
LDIENSILNISFWAALGRGAPGFLPPGGFENLSHHGAKPPLEAPPRCLRPSKAAGKVEYAFKAFST